MAPLPASLLSCGQRRSARERFHRGSGFAIAASRTRTASGSAAPVPEAADDPLHATARRPPDSPLTTEWNFYRRIIGRLLAEGHEGKWLLIKNEEIVGIWDTEAEANTVRLERFLMQPVLMKQILSQEPVLRIGYNRLCRN
jgi:hypothetical protein